MERIENVRVINHDQFLELKNQTIEDEDVVFYSCGDIGPMGRDAPRFPNVKMFWMLNCNKNFVFYWTWRSKFPNAEFVLMDSPMCEQMVDFRDCVVCMDKRLKWYAEPMMKSITEKGGEIHLFDFEPLRKRLDAVLFSRGEYVASW